MQLLRRFLILTHRYLGIPLSVLFVVWFVSGIAMIYVGGMPQLSTQDRLAHLRPLDLAAVKISPADALQRAEFGESPTGVTLLSVLGRPAYRFASGPFRTTLFADDGSPLEDIGVEQGRAIAARFLGIDEGALEYVRTVEDPDQWTLLLRRSLPLYKFNAADGAGTEVYVSPTDAEVALVTTSRTRGFAWVATIPHWFYFTSLRTNQPLWYWTVVWTSAAGCVLAVFGIALGFTQFRKSTPFRLSTSIRYVGWMRWHYILGVVFGLFALTWAFSGLLSMEPFAWTNAEGLSVERDTFTGGPLDAARFPALEAARWSAFAAGRDLKEIELRRIGGAPYYLARYTAPAAEPARERLHQPYQIGGRGESDHELIDAATLEPRRAPFDADALLARLTAALPGERVAAHEVLTEYDSYYYSRARQAPLPVLRVKFADPMRTWFYVDPTMGELVAVVHRFSRLERWLYNGLHSLDFGFWYDRRPLWDIGMITLCGGALATTSIGLWFGVRRLRLDGRRIKRYFTSARD